MTRAYVQNIMAHRFLHDISRGRFALDLLPFNSRERFGQTTFKRVSTHFTARVFSAPIRAYPHQISGLSVSVNFPIRDFIIHVLVATIANVIITARIIHSLKNNDISFGQFKKGGCSPL